ncbi:MAG: hypothetical protein GWP50_08550 [Proteobacteria bacterium]|nr:hypothetical protein [Pseudomonadota bacterium]
MKSSTDTAEHHKVLFQPLTETSEGDVLKMTTDNKYGWLRLVPYSADYEIYPRERVLNLDSNAELQLNS